MVKDATTPTNEPRPSKYPFLSSEFLELMNDIGKYGHEKYGEASFHHRRDIGDNSRDESGRLTTRTMAQHAHDHFQMYSEGVLHDHFEDEKHQLAAVAFNAMMECFFAGLVK